MNYVRKMNAIILLGQHYMNYVLWRPIVTCDVRQHSKNDRGRAYR